MARDELAVESWLAVLETLPPPERAVFVLHEVFGVAPARTARALGCTPGMARRLGHRARSHVRSRRPRFPASAAARRAATASFVAAVQSGDPALLMPLLAPDVTLWADAPVYGRLRVARRLAGLHCPSGLRVRHGDPALLFTPSGPYALLSLDLVPGDDLIAGIHVSF